MPLIQNEQGSTPPTPSTGKRGLYPKANGWFDIDDEGVETGPFGTGGGSNSIADGRLSLESGVPVSSTDQLAKTTVYYVQFRGNKIAIYNGSSWDLINIGTPSVAVPATTNTPFDVFGYNNAGVLTLETVNWTNDTTRATALVYQDGVRVKSGATTRRYLGTCRTTGVSGQCEDSVANRYVYNIDNQVPRGLFTCPGYNNNNGVTTYLTISAVAWTEANGGTGSRVRWVLGDPQVIDLSIVILCTVGASSSVNYGVGLDSVTQSDVSGSTNNTSAFSGGIRSNNKGLPISAGGHYASFLIGHGGSNAGTIYADAGRRNGEAADSPESYMLGALMM